MYLKLKSELNFAQLDNKLNKIRRNLADNPQSSNLDLATQLINNLNESELVFMASEEFIKKTVEQIKNHQKKTQDIAFM